MSDRISERDCAVTTAGLTAEASNTNSTEKTPNSRRVENIQPPWAACSTTVRLQETLLAAAHPPRSGKRPIIWLLLTNNGRGRERFEFQPEITKD
jgi:hypothetical protein